MEATTASAERAAGQLENLYWRELLWRGSLRKTPILPVPEWETLDTLKLIPPGVCVDFAPGAADALDLAAKAFHVGGARPLALSNDIAREVAAERLAGKTSPIDALSPRETVILRLVASGMTTQAIADALCLSPKTVQNYTYQIKAKLGVETDARLVWAALRAGLIASA